jgi:predicted ATPase
MAHRESELDRENRKWFRNQFQHTLLLSIELKEGKLRALNKFKIDFEYPISLIAGTNGSGKSTLLAIAACGFHSESTNQAITQSNRPYYTFNDFLVQSKQEIPPSGIEIVYTTSEQISEVGKTSNNKKSTTLKKVKDGKWATYSKRPLKNVEFFGIERVVPHYEKSISKSYKKSFETDGQRSATEENTERSVGKILSKNYSNFQFQKHSKYKLPQVSKDGYTYSGFNMGAGENALFELFFTLHSCPQGSLIVIDEIELGLHAQAQTKFIEELKSICKNRFLQIIATTHSPTALSCVPPYARYYIESNESGTIIHQHVSEALATGKLAGANSEELIIFVEDNSASTIIRNALLRETKSRVVIKPVGSNTIVARVLASIKKSDTHKNCIAFVDGDTIGKKSTLLSEITAVYENRGREHSEDFLKNYIYFIGPDINPEKWIIKESLAACIDDLSDDFELSNAQISAILTQALNEKTHKEIYHIARALNEQDESYVFNRLCKILFKKCPQLRNTINDAVNMHLLLN